MTSPGVHNPLDEPPGPFLDLRCARSSSSTRSIVSTSLRRFLPEVDTLGDVTTTATSESSIVIASGRDVSLTEAVDPLLLVVVFVWAAGTRTVAFSLPFDRPLADAPEVDAAGAIVGGGSA